MNQQEAVVRTLENLGGLATLGQLYQNVFSIEECEWKTKTPFASVRRIVQLHKDIVKIKPGLYALRDALPKLIKQGMLPNQASPQSAPADDPFSHSYYQGILLTMGNLKGFNTFAPNQDKNRYFLTKRLGEVRTLDSLPKFTYDSLLSRSATLDAIWFNERQMPHSMFEVEHSTDIHNSLLKFCDLQDFAARMVIVADEQRKKEYDKKISFSAFRDIVKRVLFVSYDSLAKQYENLIEEQILTVRL